jgi:predicted ATP-dependent endonuclease of OLD family
VSQKEVVARQPPGDDYHRGIKVMSIFEKIRVQGFRRLYDVDLKLKPPNVIIGANGSGKTSLLDVFSLLAASASGRLKETLSDLSGIDANLTNLLAAAGEKARAYAPLFRAYASQ